MGVSGGIPSVWWYGVLGRPMITVQGSGMGVETSINSSVRANPLVLGPTSAHVPLYGVHVARMTQSSSRPISTSQASSYPSMPAHGVRCPLLTSCSTSWLDLNILEQMERVARSTKDSLRTCSSSPHHDPLLRETHRPRSGMEVEGGACIQCYAPVRFPSCASPILCIPGISISHRPSLKLQSAVSVGAHYSSL